MADNVELNSGSGGATIKTDDDGTAHWQYMKLAYGADNTQTRVQDSAPLPVEIGDGSDQALVSAAGALQVDVASALPAGTNNIGDVDIASALPTGSNTIGDVTVSGTALTRLTDIETNTDYGAVTGGGTEASALRVTIANDSTGVISVDDGGGALTVDGTVTANLGATDNAVLDNIDTNTSASTSHYRNVDANAEAAIKSSAGVLHWLHVMNMTAAVAYLHLYDATTANVTPGTTTPDFTFPIPTQGDTNGAGFNLPLGPNGQSFTNAITLVCTTTIDGSTGDPGTNGVFVNAGYE